MLHDQLEIIKRMIHIDYNSTMKVSGYFVILFVNVLILISQTVSIAESWGDFVKTSSSLATYGIKLQVLYKMFFLFWRKNTILRMHECLEKRFWDTNVAGEVTEKLLAKHFKRVRLVLAGYFGAVTVVWIWFCFFPLVIYPPETQTIPLQISLPFDTNPSPLHEFVYIFLCLNSCGNVYIILVFDFLFVYLCQHLIVQFKLLQSLLLKFAECEISLKEEDITQNEEIQQVFHIRLGTYLRHHAVLIEYGNKLKSYSSSAVAIQVTVSMLSMITLGFGITKAEFSFTTLQMLLLFSCMIVEITLYCEHGSELEHESVLVSEAMYQSKWYLLRSNIRKNIVFLQMNAQKGTKLSAVGCITINKITLMQIFRQVFSSITILQSLEET